LDPIPLILQALQAGTTPDVGVQSMSADDVMDQYGGFQDLLQSKLADTPNGQALVEQYIAQPDLYEGPLVELLEDTGLDHDAELIDAAQTLMELVDVHGATRGDYTVEYDDEDLERFV
jgi:hypothetical protein